MGYTWLLLPLPVAFGTGFFPFNIFYFFVLQGLVTTDSPYWTEMPRLSCLF